ncbi:bifunctional metallophosphatase/5'-nucleotidase, partial [Cribrihabitans sp. XS_ASV171]
MPTHEGDARATGRIVSHCPLGQGAKLRLLATSDLHMHLVSHDYYADQPDPGVGLARTAGLIRWARRESEDALCLLVDNGDSLQGTPLGALAAEADAPHPLMAAFDALGYDAIGLGNHDFNFGLDRLDRMLVQAPCPVLCANLHPLGTRPRWRDAVVLERAVMAGEKLWPIRIG